MSEEIRIPIGLADITIGSGSGETPLEVEVQGDAAVLTVEPMTEAVDLYTMPHFDQLLVGWNVQLKIVLESESYEQIEAALPFINKYSAGSDNWLEDGKLFQRARDKALEITVHPADLPADNKTYDVTIFKAIATGTYERKYGKEVSKYEITFQALAKTLDYTEAGNFFQIGGY
ncbi:hypothetical protein [Candidatus Contubernalis alkaliaceticus]|uniref:hypothetical protein n=1 Tax=Candidatus Contubernalis alkaliaceticus TaxID=338645 RepID=UPI001F4C11DA|nr:hypothetical protein [Candidatus Contubernalis alkalaceticus]UNC92710.1 hypothetical protein HUE98_11755 [Candidatus Contubernalis alkalaceticus]